MTEEGLKLEVKNIVKNIEGKLELPAWGEDGPFNNTMVFLTTLAVKLKEILAKV